MGEVEQDRAWHPILLLSSDLMIQTRVEGALQAAGYHVSSISSPHELGASGSPVRREVELTEPLAGPDAVFLRSITEIQPGLIVFDLSTDKFPWPRWIHTLKTSSATRRIPVIAFGPHVRTEVLEMAGERGADLVVSRGQFLKQAAALVKDHALQVDLRELAEACHGEPSELAVAGIRLHDSGQYFDAHEELEHAWMEAPELEGYLYRALLQVTVACLHIQRGNMRGARKMLLRVRQWLDPLPDRCRGIDTLALKVQVQELRQAVEDPTGGVDPALLRPFPKANEH